MSKTLDVTRDDMVLPLERSDRLARVSKASSVTASGPGVYLEPRSAPPVEDALIGRTLDNRFRLIARIGAGGMGRVYKAVQTRVDRVVAVKVLEQRAFGRSDPAFRKRFLLEAAITSKLSHPNTIHVIDHGCTKEGHLFIAMEYLEGQTLSEVLSKTEALSWQRAMHIGQQICRSLREAHALGLVHRDLKPANVMLMPEPDGKDHVKVLDFGLVKQFAQSIAGSEITAHGMIVGSPQYMAPEQATGAGADPRSDVYALGVLLYEALCGKPPFQARQYMAVLLKHVHDKPASLIALRPDLRIPEPVEAVVMRCLEKDPARRFQTMDEVLSGIQRAMAECGEDLLLSRGNANPLRHGKHGFKRTLIFGAVGVLSVAMVASAVVGLYHFRQTLGRKAQALPSAVQQRPEPTEPTPQPLSERLEQMSPLATPSERVLFKVDSEPKGARVTLNGKPLGVTPFDFALPSNPDGSAQAALEFRLEGHQTLAVTAGGFGPEIVLIQKLQPLGARRAKADKRKFAKIKPTIPTATAQTLVDAIAEVSNPPETAPVVAAAQTTEHDLPPAAPQAEVPAEVPAAAVEEAGSMSVSSAPGVPPRMVSAQLVESQLPLYPKAALQAQVKGKVTVRCLVSEQGQASNCQVVKGLPLLDQAVIDALEASRYAPARVDGRAVAIEQTFTLNLAPPK